MIACEEMRWLLPEYAGEGLREAGEAEVHLASCSGCARELAEYRELIGAVASMRDVLQETPDGFTHRVLAELVFPERRWREEVRRLAQDRRAHVAAASLGGALVGATAIALIWWRVGRRVLGISDPTPVVAA
ncbi:MAG: hypothetical protein M3245_00200 [Actinomycetota bacterium]|nr:hypothetical protein [Actinomycetota bacterium]